MTRVEFTRRINNLIAAMILEGEQPILDWVKRSPEEQRRMVETGKSKTLNSKHLEGKAADIYFVSKKTGQLADPIRGYVFWHRNWEERGGAPMIEWDLSHFEA